MAGTPLPPSTITSRRCGRLCRPIGSLPLTGRLHAAAVADRRAQPGSTLILTGRIGVEISGLVGARGARIGLPDSLSGGVSRRAGRGDSHSEIRPRYEGLGLGRLTATTWMMGDLVTTEAPPLAGLAARRRLLARAEVHGHAGLQAGDHHRSQGDRDHVPRRLFHARHDCGGCFFLWPPCAGSGRLLLISASSSPHESRGAWSGRCYQPTKRSCSQV